MSALRKWGMIFVSLLITSESLADAIASQTSRGGMVQAAMTTSEGVRLSWAGGQMDENLKTGIRYVTNAVVRLYVPSSQDPIEIKSRQMWIDFAQQDFVFRGDVVIKTKRDILKTHFVKLRMNPFLMNSFDHFTFKNERNTSHGYGFYKWLDTKQFVFLNRKNRHE